MIVPHNFGMVEEFIFRCAEPHPSHFPFLSTLHLRTCILLTDCPGDLLLLWLEEHGVRTVTLGMFSPSTENHNNILGRRTMSSLAQSDIGPSSSTTKSLPSLLSASSSAGVAEQLVTAVLGLMLDSANYPLLITCPMGRHRTGVVVGCLRKLQKWNFVAILEEYRRFAGHRTRPDNEEFLETFDTELVDTSRVGAAKKKTVLYDVEM